MLPAVEAQAAYTENPADMTQLEPQVDGNGCVTQVHEVKFAGQDWYVIGYNDVGDLYSNGDTRITLLSKNPTGIP